MIARRHNCGVLIIGSTISYYRIVEKLGSYAAIRAEQFPTS